MSRQLDEWTILDKRIERQVKMQGQEIGTGGREDEGKVDKRLKGRFSSQDKRIG